MKQNRYEVDLLHKNGNPVIYLNHAHKILSHLGVPSDQLEHAKIVDFERGTWVTPLPKHHVDTMQHDGYLYAETPHGDIEGEWSPEEDEEVDMIDSEKLIERVIRGELAIEVVSEARRKKSNDDNDHPHFKRVTRRTPSGKMSQVESE